MYNNLILLDLKFLILLNKSKSLIILLSLIDILIHDNSNSDSDYINNNLILDIDFIIRQELKKSVILLRTRVQYYNIFNIIIKTMFNKKKQSNKIISILIASLSIL